MDSDDDNERRQPELADNEDPRPYMLEETRA